MDERRDCIYKIFEKIARRYDLLNSIFSLGIDCFWRKMAVEKMPPEGPYLDVCAGTLALGIQLLKLRPGAEVIALDFCPSMLLEGRKKLAGIKGGFHDYNGLIHLVVGDGEQMPFKGGSYQGVIVGFGLRNIIDRRAALREAYRVLKHGGVMVILEFSIPQHPLFRRIYLLYLCHILPAIGNILLRGRMYYHLRDSILKFPDQEGFSSMMRDTGFVNVGYRMLTLGIVTLHWGQKRGV